MIYVFDTSPLITLFTYYYKSRFPTLWEKFDKILSEQKIVSTRENLREIETQNQDLYNWANDHIELFEIPTADEALFIRQIYNNKHFQHNLEHQKLLYGGNIADPFVIAKAKAISGTVVTNEQFKPNAAKIPNICNHFNISCINLEEFMEQENWTF